MIREGAEAALQTFDTIDPWVLPPDCFIEVAFDHPSRADACLYLKGIERVSGRSVGFAAANSLCTSFGRCFKRVMCVSDLGMRMGLQTYRVNRARRHQPQTRLSVEGCEDVSARFLVNF